MKPINFRNSFPALHRFEESPIKTLFAWLLDNLAFLNPSGWHLAGVLCALVMTNSDPEPQTPSGPYGDQLGQVCPRLANLGTKCPKSWEISQSQAKRDNWSSPGTYALKKHKEKVPP